ncbi:TPA: hypothetical protein ACGTOP_001786 [Campylobacter coli]
MDFIFTKINNKVKVIAKIESENEKKTFLSDMSVFLTRYLKKGFEVSLEINGVLYKNIRKAI